MITEENLDEKVAKTVMGYRKVKARSDLRMANSYVKTGENYFVDSEGGAYTEIPPFSTEMSLAWKVVERVRELGFSISINMMPIKNRKINSVWVQGKRSKVLAHVHAKTVEIAICQAALTAMEAE